MRVADNPSRILCNNSAPALSCRFGFRTHHYAVAAFMLGAVKRSVCPINDLPTSSIIMG
jgi:hypothetical protein